MPKITILCYGSRGDIQPYIALSLKLMEKGFEVVVVMDMSLRKFAKKYGVKFDCIACNIKDSMKKMSPMDSIKTSTQMAKVINSMPDELFNHIMDTCLKNSRNADLMIVHSNMVGLIGISIAEKYNIPVILCSPAPVDTPTFDFPSPLMMKKGIKPGLHNYLSHLFIKYIFWKQCRKQVNEMREKLLSLHRWPWWGPRTGKIPVIYPFSDKLIPRAGNWGDNIHATGFFYLNGQDKLNSSVAEKISNFIKKYPRPIIVGFSSTILHKDVIAVLFDTLKKTDFGVIFVSGWSTMEDENLPENFFMCEEIPFEWLFSQGCLVIYSGSAGTTAEVLRSGVPSIIIPCLWEQDFWAYYSSRLKTAITIHVEEINESTLRNAINEIAYNDEYHERARHISREICMEDGLENAVKIICGYMHERD